VPRPRPVYLSKRTRAGPAARGGPWATSGCEQLQQISFQRRNLSPAMTSTTYLPRRLGDASLPGELCVKVRALAAALGLAGNTAHRSTQGNFQSCRTTLIVPSRDRREHPFRNECDTCASEYGRPHPLSSVDAQATFERDRKFRVVSPKSSFRTAAPRW
jgi:hypothetical protein